MASVEDRLGEDAEKVVKFAKHFGIPAAKQLYGKGIGQERFREFIESSLGTTGIRPTFISYGNTGGADPLQFFLGKLEEVIINEIYRLRQENQYLREKLDASRAQNESLAKLHNHRDISFEVVDFADELANQVNEINSQG